MAYIGNPPAEAYTNTVKDTFSGDGSTTVFTMTQNSLTNDVRVVVENVVQDPTVAYSCSGTTLTFTSAPPVGTNNIYVVHLGPAVMTTLPPAEIAQATTFNSNVSVGGNLIVDTNTLYVDSANNKVGIGTSSPSSFNGGANNLVIGSGSGSQGMTIYADSSSNSAIFFADGTAGAAAYTGQLNYQHASNTMSFHTNNGAERMRLDASGNLLVGTTSSFGSSGITLGSNVVYAAASSQNVANFQRYTTDGEIVRFGKDGTTVGSIGSTLSGGRLTIDGTDGVNIQTFLVMDDAIYLGGTAAGNALDDYESGTWTPTDPSGIFTGLTNVNCYYRKIGSFVYLYGRLSWSSTDNSGNLIAIGGLPFVDNSGGNTPSSGTTMIASSSWNTSTSSNSVTPHIPSGQSYLNFYPHMSSTYGAYPASSASGATEVIFQIAYVAT